MDHPVNSSIFNSKVVRRKASARQQFEVRCLVVFALVFLLATAAGAVALWGSGNQRFKSLAAEARVPESPDLYLAYFRAGVEDFVIYDGFEGAATNLQHADVLFLGNSRMMFALRDRQMLESFFSRHGLSYYMLAFPYVEGCTFPELIIRKYDLHPKWVVINADPFFRSGLSTFASKVTAGGDFAALKFRFETSAAFEVQHFLHKVVPYMAPQWPYDADFIYFRSRRNGMLDLRAFRGTAAPASPGRKAMGSVFDPSQLAAARAFDKELRARGARLILTWIPPSSGIAARQLATALNLPLLAPNVSGLNTFDGSHLDVESYRRFDNALLMELGKVIEATPDGTVERVK
jgi:hypothetical protein